MLSGIGWESLGKQVARELRNREDHSPAVSVYRWWARRPHAVMGAVLEAARERYGDNLTVADPFSGGGTVTIEAAARGLRAYAQDIHAWPALGLGVALAPCSPESLRHEASRLLDHLSGLREAYRTPDGAELSHILRVKATRCADCSRETFRFPGLMVSARSRAGAERQAFFGCCRCGAVGLRRRDSKSFTCPTCAFRAAGTCEEGKCAHCDSAAEPTSVRWHPVLVQELVPRGHSLRAVMRQVRPDDPVEVKAQAPDGLLDGVIPPGLETQRLLNAGFKRWRDLYSGRQLITLGAALSYLKHSKLESAVRDRLAYAVIGAAEMPANVSRWDRFHMKAFEAMANHRFGLSNLVVETNLLSPVGRGTLPRRLATAQKAAHWLVEAGRQPRVVRSGRPARRRAENWDVLIKTGSSREQDLPDGSVSVVVTDPPYFDDVQYGELAHLFHAWLSAYEPSVCHDFSDEAVPNSKRGVSADDYTATISAVLAESRRTLRSDGRLILTFHNRKLAAWIALATALRRAGFAVDALAVVLAENDADHCKRDVVAMLHDLVIECVPVGAKRDGAVHVASKPSSSAEKNLIAMGRALADFVRNGEVLSLPEAYAQHAKAMGARGGLIR